MVSKLFIYQVNNLIINCQLSTIEYQTNQISTIEYQPTHTHTHTWCPSSLLVSQIEDADEKPPSNRKAILLPSWPSLSTIHPSHHLRWTVFLLVVSLGSFVSIALLQISLQNTSTYRAHGPQSISFQPKSATALLVSVAPLLTPRGHYLRHAWSPSSSHDRFFAPFSLRRVHDLLCSLSWYSCE